VTHAQMPAFSPDGKHIAYNDGDQGPTSSISVGTGPDVTVHGHTLWVQDFDASLNTFSKPKMIYSDATLYPAWPSFTPDSAQVVFAVDSRSDFVSQTQGPNYIGGPIGPPDGNCAVTPTPPTCPGHGHLMLADLATGKVVSLDAANGYAGGVSYLPAGAARDNEYEFFPSVSPFQDGGFGWVLFTSRRTYGNLSTQNVIDPTTKQTWISAVTLGGTPGKDPSHPAFLLPGQEIGAGSIRPMEALLPCLASGAACSGGSDCCSGFCTTSNTDGGATCAESATSSCSRVNDRCVGTSDCCQGTNNGANGRGLVCQHTAGAAFCAMKTAE
jgi:hypothetical protein